MIEIISKPNGLSRQDEAAKRYIRENAGTISKIAQQLSGGRIKSLSQPEAAPPTVRRGPAPPSRDAEKKPYVKISLNGRVIAVDMNSGRQMHHIGEIRGEGERRRFLLATSENRFFTPLNDDLIPLLRDLDGVAAPDEPAEDTLVRTIEARLGYSDPAPRPASEDPAAGAPPAIK